MPLDRTWYNTLVDDDGSNTVGTIWNKAAVDSLMDAVDASLATDGTWTPTDASGAGLVLVVTSARYTRIGKLVSIHLNIVYPATASALPAKIGGLPFANGPAASGFYQTYGLASLFNFAHSVNVCTVFHPTTLAPRPNSDLSGAAISLAGVYATA